MTDRPVLPPGAAGRIRERVFPPVDPYLADPGAWVTERTGEHVWSMQAEILRAVADHPRVAVKSAHGVGKTWTASRLVAWWCSTRTDALAVLTGPSSATVEAVSFRELGAAVRAARLPGRLTGGNVPAWRVDGQLRAIGRKPADLTNPDAASAALQGLHARYLLGVIDEAAGVEEWVWDAMESLATTADSRILAIGNPTDPASAFAKACQPGSGWHVVTVSAFDAPAFTGERVPADVAARLVGREWVERARKRWGEASPAYVARVLAQFPEAAEDALIPAAAIERARGLEVGDERTGQPTRFGVDVARSGGDETIVAAVRSMRGGRIASVLHSARGHDLMRTTGEVARLVGAEPLARQAHTVAVDSIGMGEGVCDRLAELGLPVLRFKSSWRAINPDRYANVRAEAYWLLREELIAGRLALDPMDDDLAAQLGALRYSIKSNGTTLIESKEQLKRRGIGSPDRADALAMALYGAQLADTAVELRAAKPWEVTAFLDEADRSNDRRIAAIAEQVNALAAKELRGELTAVDARRRQALLALLQETQASVREIRAYRTFHEDFGGDERDALLDAEFGRHPDHAMELRW